MSFEREKQLCALWFQDGLTDEDRTWLREQIELGGERVPTVDLSWLSMEYEYGDAHWAWPVVAMFCGLAIGVFVWFIDWLVR